MLYGWGWGSGQSNITTCNSLGVVGTGVGTDADSCGGVPLRFCRCRHGLRAALRRSTIVKVLRAFLQLETEQIKCQEIRLYL